MKDRSDKYTAGRWIGEGLGKYTTGRFVKGRSGQIYHRTLDWARSGQIYFSRWVRDNIPQDVGLGKVWADIPQDG